MLVWNGDQRSKDYSHISDQFRPSHADYTYFAKYGLRDYRGGGRSSARETVARVAAGALAKLVVPLAELGLTRMSAASVALADEALSCLVILVGLVTSLCKSDSC